MPALIRGYCSLPARTSSSNTKRRRWLRVLLGFIVLSIALFFALTWIAASRLVCPVRSPLQDYQRAILEQASDHGLAIQRFSVRTSDGYDTPGILCEPSPQPRAALKGNILRRELLNQGIAIPAWGDVKATLVLLHGHNGRKEDHLPVAERLCAAGFRCILLDLPGHGDHPARFATFGVHEAKLPGEVLQQAARRFSFMPEPAGLFGISQGGAIALQAVAFAPRSWFAVGELSAFASLDDVITEQARQWFGPLHKPARTLVRWQVKLRAGFHPQSVRPRDAAARLANLAVLIGHGDRDQFIPFSHAQELFAAVPGVQKQFLAVPGASHHNILITSAPVYSTISAFFLKALSSASSAALPR